jgi:UDP-N-acetylenolpyruvoylglucosamine reductase
MPNLPANLIAENVPLWPLTSMRVGGAARWLANPNTVSDLSTIFAWIQEQRLPHAVLGGGSNVLFGEGGFPGVVICTRQLKGIRLNGTSVVVAAGERLSELAKELNRSGLSGLEWACGIPGTVGGAVVMNAGTRDGDMAAVLENIQILTPSGVRRWPVEDLKLGYRTSDLRTGCLEGIVLEVALKLHRDEPAHCIQREELILKSRRKTQPLGASSGCIFKNPETGPPAGMLLDRAGCKGLRVGTATVSTLHANFIVNEGSQNAADVLALIDCMRTRVLEQHGITLRQEVKVI